MKVGLVQMCSGSDPIENLLVVDSYIKEATDRGADLVCFPENVFYRGPKESPTFSRKEICLSFDEAGKLVAKTEFAQALSEIMSGWDVAVSLGSTLECRGDVAHPYNAHLLRKADGTISVYRKQHLFAFKGRTANYEESKDISPGDNVRCEEIKGIKVGMSICYDVRFPELFREMVLGRGAQVLLIPAAFATETGEAHWHTLLRARAIENQAFVVASGQFGCHTDSRGQLCECYGNSIVYGPWGETVAELAGSEEGLLVVDLDFEAQNELRSRLPALSGARFWENTARR
ncbi:MAG: nitrilase-related carbon-nitrogen hydrolase [Bdellovibrionota bacterium]